MSNWFISHVFILDNNKDALSLSIEEQIAKFKSSWSSTSHQVPVKRLRFVLDNGRDFRFSTFVVAGMELLCVEANFNDMHSVEYKMRFSEDGAAILTVDHFITESGGDRDSHKILPNTIHRKRGEATGVVDLDI